MGGERFSFHEASPRASRAMAGLERAVGEGTLERPLLELVRLRASQLNGCAFCLDMHWKDARAAGEREQRLYGLDAWRESPYYTPRERAALEWCEALTLVGSSHVPDDVYEAVRPHFDDEELADLTLAIVAINGWNRIAIATRREAGSYVPGAHAAPPSARGPARDPGDAATPPR